MDEFMRFMPGILTAIAPVVMHVFKTYVMPKIPSHLIPVILPVASMLLGSIAASLGIDITGQNLADPSMAANAVAGAMIGAGGNGIHQIKKQLAKRE